MAGPVTFSDLKTRALRRADHENSNFISAAEAGDLVNEALDEFYDMMEEQVGLEWQATEYTFNTVPGQVSYVVGNGTSSPYMDRALVVRMTYNGMKWPLEQASLLDLSRPDAGLGWISPGGVRYSVGPIDPDTKARTLSFWPAPTSVVQVTVTYVPVRTSFATPADDATTVQLLGGDTWVVLRAAQKMLRKEESDTSGLQLELNEQTQRMTAKAARANMGRPLVVTDSSTMIRPSIRNLPWWDR